VGVVIMFVMLMVMMIGALMGVPVMVTMPVMRVVLLGM
jgi:hypothetical protein